MYLQVLNFKKLGKKPTCQRRLGSSEIQKLLRSTYRFCHIFLTFSESIKMIKQNPVLYSIYINPFVPNAPFLYLIVLALPHSPVKKIFSTHQTGMVPLVRPR